LVKQKVVRDAFARIGRTLRLQPLDPSLEAAAFSGGNQQKLVIGKWIERGCRAYVLVEPTRGVDVGAKVEIWRIIEQLGRDGAAVVLVSTDFDDIAAVCTRCLVFAEGRIAGELVRPEVSAENIAAATVAGARAGPRRPLSLA
jgi:ribose transport system ATP-binding protein